MRVEGSRKLIRQMRELPRAQRDHIAKMQHKNGVEGVRVARTLAPNETGDLDGSIRYHLEDGGMVCVIDAGHDDKQSQIKAHAVEGGRDPESKTGAMDAQPYIGPTRSYLGKKHKARIKRAVNKAAKEVFNG